jgi:hypothetical protein
MTLLSRWERLVLAPRQRLLNVLHALTRKRAGLAGQIERCQLSLRRVIAELDHIDAAIRISNPAVDIGTIRSEPVEEIGIRARTLLRQVKSKSWIEPNLPKGDEAGAMKDGVKWAVAEMVNCFLQCHRDSEAVSHRPSGAPSPGLQARSARADYFSKCRPNSPPQLVRQCAPTGEASQL